MIICGRSLRCRAATQAPHFPGLEDALRWLAETPRDVPPFFPVCTLAFSVGRYDGITMPIFEETMLVGRRVGVAQAEAYVLCTHAFAARTAGRFSDASEALDRSLQVFRSLGDRSGEAFALAHRGHLHRTLGEPVRRSSASDGRPTSGPPSPTSAAPRCR